MLRPGSWRLPGLCHLVCAVCLLLPPNLLGQYTPPPTRKSCVGGTMENKVCQQDNQCPGGGSCKALNYNDTCPPGRAEFDDQGKLKKFTKVDPDPTLGQGNQKDQSHTSTRVDYFLGEWKFVEGDTDLIVRKWCMNGGPQDRSLHDFYAYEVATSTKDKETTRIAPSGGTAT